MMCADEEQFAHRFLSHQLDHGTDLQTKDEIPVTVGFQKNVCIILPHFYRPICKVQIRRADWLLASGELASVRNQAILEKYNQGYTLEQLAELFQISYRRIHQIVRQSRR